MQRPGGDDGGRIRPAVAIVLMCAAVAGCNSWQQLNENTLGQSSTVALLMEKLVVQNLVLFHLNPHAIPSQVAVSGGTVTTVDQAGISTNDPLNQSVTRAVAASTTVTTALAAHTATPSLSNQQNQNWVIEPVTAPNELDRLTALYRYVTVPGVDLCREYPTVMIAAPTPGAPGGDNPGAENGDNANAADTASWNAATAADVLEAYEAYKSAFPRGQHVDAANLRENQIKKAPPPDNQDENDWAAAVKTDTSASYGGYLRKHKGGIYAREAVKRIDALIAAAAPKQKPASPSFIPDASLLTEPDCVKCSTKANIGNTSALGPARGAGYCVGSKDIYINQRLIDNRWLAIVPSGTDVPDGIPIGSAGGFDAYVARPEAWHRFVLAIQQAMQSGAGAAGGKTTPGGTTAAPKTTTFILPAQAVPLLQ